MWAPQPSRGLTLLSPLLGLLALGCMGDLKNVNGGVDPNQAIAQVVVTPPTAGIIVGQILQLFPYGITVGGDSVAIVLDWVADGGTLLSNGTFSSGEAGSFEVIGRSRQFPFPADTAEITVTAPAVDLVDLVINPVAPILAPGEARPFLAEGHYSDSSVVPVAVTWSATGGTIDATGLYTAGSTTGAFQVIATSTTDPIADTVLVTINQIAPTVQSIVLSPDTASRLSGGKVQFSAFANYSDGTFAPVAVSYTVGSGSITAGGLYTVPQVPGTYPVIARHQASGAADTSEVTVAPGSLVRITLSPPTAALTTGSSQQFSVQGKFSDSTTAPVTVAFSATGGSITTGGLYTAGQTPGAFNVYAATPNGLFADTSTITLNAPSVTLTQIRISPRTPSVLAGGTVQFSVVGLQSDGTQVVPSVNWSATGGSINSSGSYSAPQQQGLFKVIARSTVANLADTVTVQVNPVVSLTSIQISPASVTLLTGAIQQFSATGKLSDGSNTQVTVTWSTTGGSITTGGQYSAPQTTGSFKVIALQQGGTLADTADVTVQPLAPPGSPQCQNEPPGMSQLFNTPWNAVPPLAPSKDQYGWDVGGSGSLPKLSIATDASAPVSPPNVMAGKFPRGAPGGSAPFRMNRHFSQNVTAIFVCLFTELDPGFTNNGNVGTKFGFLLTPYQGGSNGLNHYLNLTNNLGINLQSGDAALNRNMFSSFSLVGHRGQWVKIEFFIAANSPGGSDGIARMWVNGTQVLNVTNVKYFYSTQNPAFNGMTWNPTYGGGLNPVPYDMYQYIDNWYTSVK